MISDDVAFVLFLMTLPFAVRIGWQFIRSDIALTKALQEEIAKRKGDAP